MKVRLIVVCLSSLMLLLALSALGTGAAVLDEGQMRLLYGGCNNHCATGQYCGDDTNLCCTGGGGGTWPDCNNHDDCMGYDKDLENGLFSCKPGFQPGCSDCDRTDHFKRGCGPVYYCACYDLGYGVFSCLKFGDSYGHQYDYYQCDPVSGPPWYCRRNGGPEGEVNMWYTAEVELYEVLPKCKVLKGEVAS